MEREVKRVKDEAGHLRELHLAAEDAYKSRRKELNGHKMLRKRLKSDVERLQRQIQDGRSEFSEAQRRHLEEIETMRSDLRRDFEVDLAQRKKKWETETKMEARQREDRLSQEPIIRAPPAAAVRDSGSVAMELRNIISTSQQDTVESLAGKISEVYTQDETTSGQVMNFLRKEKQLLSACEVSMDEAGRAEDGEDPAMIARLHGAAYDEASKVRSLVQSMTIPDAERCIQAAVSQVENDAKIIIQLHSALQKLVATTETAGRESSESSVDEEAEAEVLLAREAIRSCIEGHVQRGGGTDTLESALLHSAKSQGHGRLL